MRLLLLLAYQMPSHLLLLHLLVHHDLSCLDSPAAVAGGEGTEGGGVQRGRLCIQKRLWARDTAGGRRRGGGDCQGQGG